MGDKRRTTRVCDLCSEAVARVRCESDEAALCWNCDAAVHGANFLVARHVRALMCRACLGPTPWLASGARVGPAASLCCSCAEREESGEGEGEGENQIVPLKLAPPVSDDEEEEEEEAESSSSALHADDDLSCSSTQRSDSRSTEAESNVAEHEATSFSSDRNPQRSRLRKRSYARTLVHASPSSNY